VFEPRLIKVACPHCGAGLQINPQATVATCTYCQRSSFIHIPNRADPPAPNDTQNYGHIHVSEVKAQKAVAITIALMLLVLVLALGGVMTAMMFRGTKPHRTPPPPSTRSDDGNSDACNRAVTCCKALLGSVPGQPQNQRTCEALRALSDADCKKQHETFRDSAKQLGQTCD
jgi:hypothetical protein